MARIVHFNNPLLFRRPLARNSDFPFSLCLKCEMNNKKEYAQNIIHTNLLIKTKKIYNTYICIYIYFPRISVQAVQCSCRIQFNFDRDYLSYIFIAFQLMLTGHESSFNFDS